MKKQRHIKLPSLEILDDRPYRSSKKVNQSHSVINLEKSKSKQKNKSNPRTSKSVISLESPVKHVDKRVSVAKQSVNSSSKKPITKRAQTTLAQIINHEDQQQPFKGLKIVLTGVINSGADRKEVEKVIEKFGARCTGQVSGNTDILIHGEYLEDGRVYSEGNKYKNAQERGTLTVSENELNAFLMVRIGKNLSQMVSCVPDTERSAARKKFYISQKNKKVTEPEEAIVQVNQSLKNAKEVFINKKKFRSQFSKLWTEKYKPFHLSEIIGNEENIIKLEEWLKDWKEKSSKTKNFKKCLLISGSPGIGKTTAVTLVIERLGFDKLIQNASDVRNKSSIEKGVNMLNDNEMFGEPNIEHGSTTDNLVIVMDEVDGMSSDRGGIKALIDMISRAKHPIICIANDRQSLRSKSLTKYCLELKFEAPSADDIFERVAKILSIEMPDLITDEGMANVFEIIQQNSKDIRQILTYLSLWGREVLMDKKLSIRASKDNFYTNTFDACAKILTTTVQERDFNKTIRSLFFVDYNLMNLLVFENYSTNMSHQHNLLENMDEALNSMCIGDKITKVIRTYRNYSLLPTLSFFAAAVPAAAFVRNLRYVQFPMALARFSSSRKRKREFKELRDLLGGSFIGHKSGSVGLIALTLMNVIGGLFAEEKFDEVMRLYKEYGISPSFIKEVVEDICSTTGKKVLFDTISSQSKSKFSRLYSNYSKSSQISLKSKKLSKSKSEEEVVDSEENSAAEDILLDMELEF